MAKQTTYNVGIYVRLSQEDERAGESLSIENQKKMLTLTYSVSILSLIHI